MEKEEFKPLSFWQELFLKRKDMPEYYNAKRAYLHERGESLKGLKLRKQNITVLDDKHVETEKPVIYAITHIGKFDYQIVSEVIKEHQVPFSGDPETMYRTFDGTFLGLNGIIYCDTENKEDRKIATSTSIELLKSGYNLLIYPEGIWNVTPNALTVPLFPGIIRMALSTGCDIVPIAVEQYDKDFYVNIGKNFKVDELLCDSEEEEIDYINSKKEELRDIMATLKWEIFEKLPQEERKNIGDYATSHRNFVDRRLFEWFNKKENKPYYNPELIKHRTFREKGVVLAEDAFSYFKDIKLNKNNAYLFRKDESLPVSIQEVVAQKLDDFNKRK